MASLSVSGWLRSTLVAVAVLLASALVTARIAHATDAVRTTSRSARGGVSTSVIGTAWTADNKPVPGAQGRHLDVGLDEGRPFRPLEKDECSGFLDHPETRELLRRMEKAGVDRAAFKIAALLEVLSPLLPRIRPFQMALCGNGEWNKVPEQNDRARKACGGKGR